MVVKELSQTEPRSPVHELVDIADPFEMQTAVHCYLEAGNHEGSAPSSAHSVIGQEGASSGQCRPPEHPINLRGCILEEQIRGEDQQDRSAVDEVQGEALGDALVGGD